MYYLFVFSTEKQREVDRLLGESAYTLKKFISKKQWDHEKYVNT